MLFYPALVESGYITTPWHHICEGLEKSNHHAHKDFQTRTMRGGGLLHHQDPMFLEGMFSYCKFLKLGASTATQDLDVMQAEACQYVRGVSLADAPAPTYLAICQKPHDTSSLPVGERTELPLTGMRFYVIGSFGNTAAAKEAAAEKLAIQEATKAAILAAKKARRTRPDNPPPKPPQPQEIVEQWIRKLGGKVYDKAKFQTLTENYSQTPHCFILMRDCRELDNGTCTAQELTERRLVSVLHYIH